HSYIPTFLHSYILTSLHPYILTFMNLPVHSRVLKSARENNFQIYGVPLLSRVAFLTIVPTLLNTFRDQSPDFTMFIISARLLRQGLDPYRELLAFNGGNKNPPATLFAMVPLPFLTDRLAFAAWTTV